MRTKHIHLDLDINFEERILSGFCLLSIEKEDDSGKKAFPRNSQCLCLLWSVVPARKTFAKQ